MRQKRRPAEGDVRRRHENGRMLKLYGQYRSRAFRVAWLCKESNIPYEHSDVTINVDSANCKESWYIKLNPNGRVPTIDDNGFVMWESAAINLYLAEKYNSPLWPADVTAKGWMLQWTFFATNDIEPPMIAIRMNRLLPRDKRDAKAADEAERTLLPKLKIVDNYLSTNRFFGVDRWDMADFMVASICYTFFVMKYDLSTVPNFEKWLIASLDRPKAREARALRE